MEKGTLYCVSTGPGDPELMTLKAVRILQECPAAAVTVSKAEPEALDTCVAYQIARQASPCLEEKELLYLVLPMTRDLQVLEESHENAAKEIIRFLDQGKSVAYLTLGDVSVYASCMYPAALVKQAGYPVEMISGVPSFCAAAAAMGRPLVSGGQQLHILPSSYEIGPGLAYPGVKVLMKAGRQIGRLRQELQENGIQAWGVQRCGMPGQKLYRSAEEIDEKAGYYTIIVAEGEGRGSQTK